MSDPQIQSFFVKCIHFMISVEMKHLEKSYGLPLIFQQIELLHHENDGLLFTSAHAPYSIGQCHKMLKWKPSHLNSVDFKVHVIYPSIDNQYHTETTENTLKQTYMLQVASQDNLHEDYSQIIPEEKLLLSWEKDSPQDKIIECFYDHQWPHYWRFMRYRHDKNKANHITVLPRILDSIHDAVSRDQVPI